MMAHDITVQSVKSPQKNVRFGEREQNDVKVESGTIQQSSVCTSHSVVPKCIGASPEISDRRTSFMGTSDRSDLTTGSVRLHRRKFSPSSSFNLASDQHEDQVEKRDVISGFVEGNFSSGKVLDITVDRCYVMAYQCNNSFVDWKDDLAVSPSLLAVGTVKGLSLYETNTYALVHETTRSAMVSAIRWLSMPSSPSFSSNMNKPSLVAVGGLDGKVSLYLIDPNILECQGPTLLYEFHVKGQVRAMDCGYIGNLDDQTLLITVGDKTGDVTFCSLRFQMPTLSLQHIDTVVEQHCSTGVLGMSLSVNANLFATSTKAGDVFVYRVERQNNGVVYLKETLWETERHGPVRCVLFSSDGTQLCFGGYDKTVVFVETESWVCSRQLQLQGTINTVSFDHKGRYFGVGCRDKTFTIFDTSTYMAVKTFHVTGWVTSVSWGPLTSTSIDSYYRKDIVAVRSDNTCISILDLTPTTLTQVRLASQHGEESSVSWSADGALIARAFGSKVVFADYPANSRDIGSIEMKGEVVKALFCQAFGRSNLIAAVDNIGNLSIANVELGRQGDFGIDVSRSICVATSLKALAWSHDGSVVATGGKDKILYIFDANNLTLKVDPIKMQGRIWDIDFVPEQISQISQVLLGVALGDYSTILLNENYEPVLQVSRSRTCRCLSFSPTRPVVAIGDGAGIVTIIDYNNEELVKEIDVKSRVNVLEFSPVGDFLVIGTDDSRCGMHETTGYQCLQEFSSTGFALSSSFSPTGVHLALGSSSASYCIVRLGPFLGIDLVPLTLEGGIEQIPPWALKEVLFRSCDGPSFIQRHMTKGGSENLRRVAAILRLHPSAIYTVNRQTNEGSFATTLELKIPNLLKLVLTALVDGTLAPKNDEDKNFLTTEIPKLGRQLLSDIIKNYPPEFAVDIFNAITFMKVPFTSPKVVDSSSRLEVGSSSYTDPWHPQSQSGRNLVRTKASLTLGDHCRGALTRTPAVLPLPGLGDMNFLVSLLLYAPSEVFENQAMAVVVRVMWFNHIRQFFFIDCTLFAFYYISWVVLVELTFSGKDPYNLSETSMETSMALCTGALNTIFAIKEMTQASFGHRDMYWRSIWNTIDIVSILCVYIYILNVLLGSFTPTALVPLAVVTSLLLTSKALSYLRGFSHTGWLISVLIANFRDVRGFLIILFTILIGFSVSFRILFGDTDAEAYGSLRRSLLSTFQMTLTSEYDAETISNAEHNILGVFTFALAVTCVLVVALNALISVLADSYARVQQNAVANRRKEIAALIVEYMSLLSSRKRLEIEAETKWFHTLLEVDTDGSLQIQADDWEGGLNALRRDIQDMTKSNMDDTQRAVQEMKVEFDSELLKFKREVVAMLEVITDDMKYLRRAESQGIKLDGRNVVKAVQAVQAVGQKVGQHGGAFLKLAEGNAVKSLGQYRGKAISTFTRT